MIWDLNRAFLVHSLPQGPDNSANYWALESILLRDQVDSGENSRN